MGTVEQVSMISCIQSEIVTMTPNPLTRILFKFTRP